MIKKILLLILILSIPAITFAKPYVGFTVGGSKGHIQLIDPSNAANNFNLSGWSGGVFTGLNTSLENMYMAGEIFAYNEATHTTSIIIQSNGATVNVKPLYSFGVSFIPGYWFVRDNWIINMRVGLIQTRFKTSQNPLPNTTYSGTSTNYSVGGQIGFGVQTFMQDKISLRLEYVYTNYNHFNVFGNRIYPQNNQLMVGFIYQFC